MIAVHCGAGYHSNKLHKEYNSLCRKACRKAIEVLRAGGTALEAVTTAVVVLENDALTNCGFGSNLTLDGVVENDASVMDGKTLAFGACGAVKHVKNPVKLAHDICMKQVGEQLPLGLVLPTLLVGKGAVDYARASRIKVVSHKRLVSVKALKQFRKYRKMLENHEKKREVVLLDTVGAVCIDNSGHVASACSSGGLLLKKPGRVGQAAIYGSGAYADSFDQTTHNSIAVCTTGCGEYLVKTLLAKTIADALQKSTSPCQIANLHRCIKTEFVTSKHLTNVNEKLGGALVIHHNNSNNEVSLLYGHTTQTMGVAYMKCEDRHAVAVMSELPQDAQVGRSVNVGGTFFVRK